jgi:hypothetical protein
LTAVMCFCVMFASFAKISFFFLLFFSFLFFLSIETTYVTHPMLEKMGRTGGDFFGIKGGGMDMGSRAFVVLGDSKNDVGVYYLDSRMV